MSSSEEEEEDDAYYDLAQPTVTTSRSAASTIILNRLDDLEFSLTGCDYDHTERDRRRAVAKLTDAAARNPLAPVWRAAKRLLTPKDLRYLLKGVLPKSLTPKEVRPRKDQPFYHLLAESNDVTYEAYVSEQNLLLDQSKEPVRHPLIEEIFSGKKGASYHKISN